MKHEVDANMNARIARCIAGRLWINRLARAAVLSPRLASSFVSLARSATSDAAIANGARLCECSVAAAGFHRVRHQHRDRHRADAAGHGRDRGRSSVRLRQTRHRQPADNRARSSRSSTRLIPTSITTAPSRTCSRLTNCGWPIAAIRMSAERVISARLLAARMHDRHGRVSASAFLHEKKRERFAHDHAAAEHDDVRAGDFDSAFDQQSLTTERRAGDESGLDRPARASRHSPDENHPHLLPDRARARSPASSICGGGGDCTRIP